MNNSVDPKRSDWRGLRSLSILAKAQLVGALLGVILPWLNYWAIMQWPTENLEDPRMVYNILAVESAVLVLMATGQPLHSIVNDRTDGPSHLGIVLICATQAFVGYVLGTLVGLAIRWKRRKKVIKQ